MKRKNIARSALFTSIISLLLCVSMLVGTTFAWFTDSATTGVNTIVAGNLDLEVYYATPADVVNGDVPEANWKKVDANTPVFNPDALWEPGYTEVVFFKFDNAGTLAFQYQLQVDILNETLGKTKDGADIQLSNYIQAYACNAFTWNYKDFLFTDRDNATDPEGAPNPFHDTLYNAANGDVATPSGDNPLSLDSWQWLDPTETTYATLVLWMPTEVGNEANHNGVNVPSIDLGVSVVATQYTYEEDSFDDQYDVDAEYPVAVDTAEGLIAALAAGDTVTLSGDIDVADPIVVNGNATINLNGHTLNADTANGGALTVSDGATLNISNGAMVVSSNGANQAIAATNTVADTTTTVNLNDVEIVLEAPEYENEDANCIYANAEAGEVVVNINEGTVITSEAVHHAAVLVGQNATVNMNAGEIDVKNTDSTGGWTCVWAVVLDDDTAVFNMNDGVINVEGDHSASGIYAYGPKCTINMTGGTINVETTSGYGIAIEGYSAAISLTGGEINVKATAGAGASAILSSTKGSVVLGEGATINVYKSVWDKNEVYDPDCTPNVTGEATVTEK